MAEHRRGANLPAIGGFNRTVVLDAVRRSEAGLSRVEIAGRTGLSPQTVSNVTRHLLDIGMVVETGTVVSGRGKPRTILQLDATSRYAIGVHVDPAVVTYVLLDLAGRVVADATTATPSAANPEQVVERMAGAVADLVRGAAVDPEAVLGVGVASPGPIDRVAGVVLDPPFLPRWRDVPLRDALADATGYPVLLEKDVTAAAVGETWLAGASSPRNFVFAYYGTGFGVGLVLDHEPVRGVGANAGDAGHVIVEQGSLAATRQEVGQGPGAGAARESGPGREGRGEVGWTVAPERLVAFAARAGVPLEGLDDGVASDIAAVDRAFTALSRAAAAGDDTARTVIAEVGAVLGRAMVVIVNLLDVDRVVFGGPFWSRIAAHALPAATAAITGSPILVAKHPVTVVESAVGEDVAAVGAACLVLDGALSPRASSMLIAH